MTRTEEKIFERYMICGTTKEWQNFCSFYEDLHRKKSKLTHCINACIKRMAKLSPILCLILASRFMVKDIEKKCLLSQSLHMNSV
jgi:hypothetical protein